MLRTVWPVWVTIAVGLVAAAVALDERHTGDAFVARQRGLEPVAVAEVERVVRTAPAPTAPRKNGMPTTSCQPRGGGELRNPWLCSLRYRTGLRLRYLVTVHTSGSYVGQRQGDPSGFIRGCCISVAG
jgi:hypothetical protein